MGSMRHLQNNDIGGMLGELSRRVRDLERAPALRNTSMTSGTTTIRDDNDVARVKLGLVGDDSYGLAVYDDAGTPTFRLTEAGQVYPYEPLPVSKWDDSVAVNAASFVPVWAATCSYATADAVQLQTYVAADAGTTGEVRLSANLSGTPTTDAIAIADGSGDYREWKWAPSGLVAGTGPVVFTLEARRTGGSGDVNVYPPVQSFMTTAEAIGASGTGV